MKVLLWDIDGTLIRTGRAGHRAMNAAALATFGLENAFAHFDFGGRTDPWVLDQLRRGHQLDLSPEVQDRFYGVYLRHLSSELDNPHALTCSGIRDLIASLHADDGWSLGLLTGNIRAGARVKLEHFGLWQYFPFGAFADDSGDRNRLGPVALERARQHLGRPDLRHTDLVVIGDTPHDIACARAVGAHAVATATGGASYDELAAHTPDLIVRDFSDPTPFLEFIRGLK